MPRISTARSRFTHIAERPADLGERDAGVLASHRENQLRQAIVNASGLRLIEDGM
ncbi:hypothetical protein ACIPCF_18410 (plasmid) [Paracoccus marcusii]|uniref:hypothetical protein n=1 Tax=Paracoccus TaxID=265 RepID=UPI00189131B7|nr:MULTISPECIES: hypothetical protein [Paracoccus]